MNGFLWAIGIAEIVLLGYRKKNILKIYRGICVYISLIQIVSLIYLLFTTDLSEVIKHLHLVYKLQWKLQQMRMF